jgi:hypothetical protein
MRVRRYGGHAPWGHGHERSLSAPRLGPQPPDGLPMVSPRPQLSQVEPLGRVGEP